MINLFIDIRYLFILRHLQYAINSPYEVKGKLRGTRMLLIQSLAVTKT